MSLKEKIEKYILEAEDKISQCRILKKYKKVSFTKKDFWNFTLLKDNNELFLSYDKIVEEKNIKLLLEILKRFENIKIIASNKDYNKLAIDTDLKNRIIIEDDVYERAYRSDFFMLFEGKQRIFEFVRDYTTARFYTKEHFNINDPLLPILEFFEKIKDNIENSLLGKLINFKPKNWLDMYWELLGDCFYSVSECRAYFDIKSSKINFVLDKIKYEVENPNILAKIKILIRLRNLN